MAERAPRTSNGFLRETACLSSSSTKTLLEDINISLTSWPEFIVAVTSIYMHKLTGENDIVLGLPMMGRLGSASIHTPSMVMNLVPLRLDCNSKYNSRRIITASF
ncbi:condensation domain-containing protein [Bacillus pacificus]